jgi:cytochrome P450
MPELEYNPFDPAVRANPYPTYARLRAEAPIHRNPALGLAAVSRYEDVMAVLKNPSAFSSRAMRDLFTQGAREVMSDANIAGETLIGSDPPVHTRLRKIVNRAFTPSRIAALEGRVRGVTDELVGRFEQRGSCDLMSELAVPLPVTLIAEILGVDSERQRDFKRWSDDLLLAGTGQPTPKQAERIVISDEELGQWIDEVVEERRAFPKDDLISTMVAAESTEDVMTAEEIGNLIVILLIAGNETTTNLIANAMLALLAHPEQLDTLVACPELVPLAVEEALRYDSPVQLTLRRATADVELAGGKLAEGEMVAVLVSSANRDERQFADASRFDLARDTRGHVAFGFGTHFCVGAGLARLEARVALEALVTRLARIERVETALDYGTSLIVRGPRRLRLRFDPHG